MRAGLHIIPPIFQYVCICHALKPRASRRTTLQAQVGGSIRPRFLAPLLILRPIPGPAFWPLSMQLCGWGLAVSTQVRGQRWLPAARGWDGVVGGGWLGERAARTSKAMDEPASGRRATQSRQHGCGRTLRDWSGGQVASAPATLPTSQGRPGGSSKGSWAVGAQHPSAGGKYLRSRHRWAWGSCSSSDVRPDFHCHGVPASHGARAEAGGLSASLSALALPRPSGYTSQA